MNYFVRPLGDMILVRKVDVHEDVCLGEVIEDGPSTNYEWSPGDLVLYYRVTEGNTYAKLTVMEGEIEDDLILVSESEVIGYLERVSS